MTLQFGRKTLKNSKNLFSSADKNERTKGDFVIVWLTKAVHLYIYLAFIYEWEEEHGLQLVFKGGKN